MMKRVLTILLCLAMFVGMLAGCGGLSGNDKGAYISMYLNDETFDFDPVNAYHNTDSLNMLGLIYEPLFTLSSGGKIENALASGYTTYTDDEGFHMDITMRETRWSDGSALTANDIVYAWTRLLDPGSQFAAASLLFDVKNARAYNKGYTTDLYIEAIEQQKIRLTFEGEIDVNAFLLNLTNVATAPLSEYAIQNNPDWAKSSADLLTNGPFKVTAINYAEALDEAGFSYTVSDDYIFDENGNRVLDANGKPKVKYSNTVKCIQNFILERNSNYYRDTARDSLDKYVTPYRIIVDCTKSDAELLQDYRDETQKLFYIGSIPLSIRKDEYVSRYAKVTNALSTFVCYLNENAIIDGDAIFADVHVRRALSLVLDRNAIAEEIVYAEAATALVNPAVFEKGTSGSFRNAGGELISPVGDLNAAKSELEKVEISGFDPRYYSFSIKVASYDEVHVRMANLIAQAWSNLGFDVTVKEMYPIENNDTINQDGEKKVKLNVCDDLFAEALQRGTFEAIVFDYNAYAPSAYAMLSSFALDFSGRLVRESSSEYTQLSHITGYNSEEYNALMQAVYFIPYFSQMSADPEPKLFNNPEKNPYFSFGFETYTDYIRTYQKVNQVYAEYKIEPTEDSGKWEEQKAILLHAAEKLLMEDMPVIPIVFNKNAVMASGALSNVYSTYYIPALFTKTNLKNYKDYTYVFNDFPKSTNWQNYGLQEEPAK